MQLKIFWAIVLVIATGLIWLSLSLPTAKQASRSVAAGPEVTVEPSQLVTHLTALATERYHETDKSLIRDYLSQTLTDYGLSVQAQPYDTGINLVATRVGQTPSAGTLLVGAHYDSVQGSPGADDNASALAVALEVAHWFASHETQKTLKIVFFDQEEVQSEGYGLLGSTAFVEQVDNLVNLEGAIILEMVGFTCDTPGCQRYPSGLTLPNLPDRGNFLGVIGDLAHPKLLEAFQTGYTDMPVLTLPVPASALRMLPDLMRSDHAPFWRKGIGALMVTDTANFRNSNYHLPSDTLETLDIDFLTTVTQQVIQSVETLLG
jgi:Peptidase family M28